MRAYAVVIGVVGLVACSNGNRPFCGDGICGGSDGENCMSCRADCGSCSLTCGDGVCSSGDTCTNCPSDCGSCMTSSCSATCGGCCDGDSCLGGTSSSACGIRGGVCADCGPDRICASGLCLIDPASRWNVVLETLTVANTRYDGVAWDTIGGTPDPFVSVYVGSETATPSQSAVADDAYSVRYDGGATVSGARSDALMAYLGFRVTDADTGVTEDIGYCDVFVVESTFTGTTQTLNCPIDPGTGNSGFVLTWHLERF